MYTTHASYPPSSPPAVFRAALLATCCHFPRHGLRCSYSPAVWTEKDSRKSSTFIFFNVAKGSCSHVANFLLTQNSSAHEPVLILHSHNVASEYNMHRASEPSSHSANEDTGAWGTSVTHPRPHSYSPENGVLNPCLSTPRPRVPFGQNRTTLPRMS